MSHARPDATPLYLALDQGGHSSRALVMSSTGEIVAKAQVSIDTQVLSNERIEHSARELAESLRRCCDLVANDLGADCARIVSAGLATQRSSIVCWRRSSGDALSPVLSWQDRRAAGLIESLAHESQTIRQLTGLVMSPHYGASKLRWCLTHLDEVQIALSARDLTIGPLASYLVRALTGAGTDVCDPANASRTLLWNRHTRGWSERLCNMFGIDRSLLPDCVPTRYQYGHVTVGKRRVPLGLVTGDQSAAIYAFGRTARGVAYSNLGTGAFMQCPIGQQAVDVDGLLNSVVYQDNARTEYVLEGTVNGAGRALTWWGEQTTVDPKFLVSEALRRYVTDDGFANTVPVFLNGISGLGAPYWISDFHSRFVGCDFARDERDEFTPAPEDGRDDIIPAPEAGALAILDSIAFLLNANVERAASRLDPLERLVLTGGLASVDYLCQTLADVSGIPAVRSTLREATAKGVGFLLSEDRHWPGLNQLTRFEPDANAKVLQRHRVWRRQMDLAISKDTV